MTTTISVLGETYKKRGHIYIETYCTADCTTVKKIDKNTQCDDKIFYWHKKIKGSPFCLQVLQVKIKVFMNSMIDSRDETCHLVQEVINIDELTCTDECSEWPSR